MNCLLNPTTDAELNKYDTYVQTFPLEDAYATTPMAVLNVAEADSSHSSGFYDKLFYGPNQAAPAVGKEPITSALSFEEEVYSEFEQAISGRLQEVQQKLQYLSASSASVRKPAKSTTISARLSAINWQYVLFFGSLAFIFTLLGFDAMGLLVLFSR
jgi:hypothetical protein